MRYPGGRRAGLPAASALLLAGAIAVIVLAAGRSGRVHTVTAPAPAPRPRAPAPTGRQSPRPPARTRTRDRTAAPPARSPAPAHTGRRQPPAPAPKPRPSPRTLAGAKIVVPMQGTYPDRWLLGRARAGEIGGVIIFADNVSDRLRAATRALQKASEKGTGHRLLIATDQEGGTVKRLEAAPPEESALEMTPQIAEREGRATARALLAVGINMDLAPVADVAHPGNFLGTRTFASSPGRVALDACRFARGLARGGVKATFKHFPGLGGAVGNTDEAQVTVGLSRPELLADLAAYRRCSPPLVMVSTAAYPGLGAGAPAVFSRKVVTGLLRGRLGYRGATITDTLDGPAVAAPGRAVRASRAGIDLLLYTQEEHEGSGALRELLSGLAHGKITRGELEGSYRRIRALTG